MLAYAVKKGIVLRMLTRSIKAQPPGAIVTALRHLLCILALMWVGIANGQPLFFSTDSTNYIRAADVKVRRLPVNGMWNMKIAKATISRKFSIASTT